MAFAPGPTVVRVQYSTAYGFHTQQLHMRAWTPPETGHDLGFVDRWSDDAPTDVEDMLLALLALEVPFFPVSTGFNVATIYTQATPTSPLIPQVSKAIAAVIGTNVVAGWSKAVEETIVLRTTNNGVAKIVLLDCDSENSFDADRVVGNIAKVDDLVVEFSDTLNGWTGQDDGRPATFIGAFKTLNERLRKSYRMT
jgi:hypothetical protein